VRLVIAEDTVLLREGLAGLLEDAGHTVLARVGDADSLLATVAEHEPDLAIVDVRMPPTYEDEGMADGRGDPPTPSQHGGARSVVKQLLLRPQDARAELTPREREVLWLMAEGKKNSGIA
jgi:DNA-binding NarL/FixJ family response regulator